jgi:copper oxidase (laccase) domain-containing protein
MANSPTSVCENSSSSPSVAISCQSQMTSSSAKGICWRASNFTMSGMRFFSTGIREGHLQFDIAGYVAARLAAAGLVRIEMLDEDTYSQPDRFYSYRRSVHRNEADYGRHINAIVLSESRTSGPRHRLGLRIHVGRP